MRRDEDGASALEMCLWVVPLLGVGTLLAMMMQFPMAKLDVTAAANDAARAASLQRDSGTAAAAARTAATTALRDSGRSCADMSVSVDVSDFRPNGNVTARVTCTAQISDLVHIGLPSSKTFTATANSPIDRYREE